MGQVHSSETLPPVGNAEAIDFATRQANTAIDPSKEIDMRSDTVTTPTHQMRAAMALAEVGDDVLGHDPTAAQLEAETASLFGKDSALLVPSGTMANLIAIMVHCELRGSEIIVGDKSHIHIYEQGGCASVAGVHCRVLPNLSDGTMDLDAVRGAVRDHTNDHFPCSRVLCLENTHNKCGGLVLPVDYMDRAGKVAKENGMQLHVDGARIMNAVAALETTPKRIVQSADSVSFCLSKGLGAPVGSLLIGSFEFIRKARRMRKLLGGGMRQIGPVAAAGLCALKYGPERLLIDHSNARRIAEEMWKMDKSSVDLATVQSNIIMIQTGDRDSVALEQKLKDRGVLVIAVGPHTIRIVLHHQVSSTMVESALYILREVMFASSQA